MIRFARWTALVCVLGFLALGTLAAADEDSIPAKELPGAVLKIVKANFPKAEIVGAAKEEEDGNTTYEVMLKVAGRAVDMAIQADGTILEIEKEISVDELPAAVRKALATRYPRAKITRVETLRKGADGPVNYEIAIQTEIVLSPKGQAVGAGSAEDPPARAKKPQKGEDEDEDDEKKPSAKSKKSKDREEGEDEDDDDDKKGSVKSKKSKKDREEGEDEDDDDDKKRSVKSKKSKKDHEEGEDEDDDDDKKGSVKSKKSKKDHEKGEDEDDDDGKKRSVKSKKSKRGHEEGEDEDDDDDKKRSVKFN